jgi:hypothetical protein
VKKTFLVANCGMQGAPGPSGQSGITSVYLVKKICWTGVEAPGQLAPAQPPPLHPPVCEISCNPNDFFLSSACGEGEVRDTRSSHRLQMPRLHRDHPMRTQVD